MSPLWMAGDVARYIGKSHKSVKNYEAGKFVTSPPPTCGILTNGARVYDPDAIAVWWSQELTARAGGVPYDAIHA